MSRSAIMALPMQDQLPAALDLIEVLTGGDSGTSDHWMGLFNFTHSEARIFAILASRPGAVYSQSAIWDAVYFDSLDPPSIKVIDVFVCKMRKKIKAKDAIVTDWGRGFSVSADFISSLPKPKTIEVVENRTGDRTQGKHCRRWKATDDEELLAMQANGSELWAMADEFERSERAILGRLTHLKART